MAKFYPLYLRRSDGKVEVLGKGKRRERNEPTAEQLDQKPDKNGVSDFYREVGFDEVKHLDWRRKLGGMLARELDWKDRNGHDNACMLVTFPENYRLFEHVKKTEKDGKTEIKSKTHAAGGNDRQDAYLYGHPAGRRKRYRSPADFFPHLLWLCTDETGDPDNCGCKICSPEDLENAIPGAKVKREKASKHETVPPPPFINTTANNASRQPNSQAAKVRAESGVAAGRSPRALAPTPLPPRKSHDHEIDSLYRSFTYRPGEVVWFRRGQAWGLGAVIRRWSDGSNANRYAIQPLSHPYHHPSSVMRASEVDLRPWLAWSVPMFTNDRLNQMDEPPRYNTADWEGMMSKRYGNGDMEVDGSILAAKAVDATYTPFGPSKPTEAEPGAKEIRYDGIFLGAEKIWVGEPVRIHTNAQTDIAVVHAVVERSHTSTTGQQTTQQSTRLIGDVYTLAVIAHANPNIPTPASPSNNPHLPQRLTEDLADRNARSIHTRGMASYWRLVGAQLEINLDDVKGRWYEASLLLPLLQPEKFEQMSREGDIRETSLWMNARGDCVNSNRSPSMPRLPKTMYRAQTRIEAFGKAIPPGSGFRDGVEMPEFEKVDPALADEPMDIDSRFGGSEAADPVHNHTETHVDAATGLEEFMNLDGTDDASQLPGFGQTYNGQDSQGRSFY